jgi:hypothetical protein
MIGNARQTWGYEQRVSLVADTLRQHSEMSPETATELAKHVLHAIDYIPERVR